MKKLLTGTGMILGLAASLCVAVAAQQTPQQGQQQQNGSATAPAPRGERMGRMGKHHGKMGREGGGHMKLFRELNLSDTQKQQMRAIHEKAQQGTQAQREELRGLFQTRQQGGQLTPEQETRARELRTQLRDANQRTMTEGLAILTPEQRKQLEQKREEFKQRRREMRGRRGDNDNQNDEQP